MKLFLRAIPFWLFAVAMGACLAQEEVPSLSDDETDGRVYYNYTMQFRMAYALYQRLLAPAKAWREHPGLDAARYDRETHLCLLIEPDDGRYGIPIYFKLDLDYAKEGRRWVPQYQGDPGEEGIKDYVDRKLQYLKDTLYTKLFLAFEQEFEGPCDTFAHGTVLLLRMPTEHSDPMKYHKEDVINRN